MGEVKCYVEPDGSITKEFNFPWETGIQRWFIVGPSQYSRCCNCGQPVPAMHRSLVAYRPDINDGFAICNEGCAIDLIQRGHCSTTGEEGPYHPWDNEGYKYDESDYPELKRVRDLIRLNNPEVSFE